MCHAPVSVPEACVLYTAVPLQLQCHPASQTTRSHDSGPGTLSPSLHKPSLLCMEIFAYLKQPS